MQTIGQLLGAKEILNGVDFSAVREQKQEVFGATQNIGQIGSAKESSLEVHSISPNESRWSKCRMSVRGIVKSMFL